MPDPLPPPSRYFSPETDPALFQCPGHEDCDAPAPSTALLAALDRLRAHVNRPVTVTSGVRCAKHNAAVGGAADSEHVTGNAADLLAPTPSEMDELVEASYVAGFVRRGVYQDGHLHVDVSPSKDQHVLWVR